jgi:hypothetical protein
MGTDVISLRAFGVSRSTRLRDLFDLGGRSAQRPRLSCLRQPRGHKDAFSRWIKPDRQGF